MTVVCAGVAIGAATAYALSQLVRSMLFAVQPGDPVTTVVMALSVIVASLIASVIPAQRAAWISSGGCAARRVVTRFTKGAVACSIVDRC